MKPNINVTTSQKNFMEKKISFMEKKISHMCRQEHIRFTSMSTLLYFFSYHDFLDNGTWI